MAGDVSMVVRGKRTEGGDGGRGWEPAPRGWEDHMGAGIRRVEGWACQMGRSHEGHDVEGDCGQLRVSPRQPRPAYQTVHDDGRTGGCKGRLGIPARGEWRGRGTRWGAGKGTRRGRGNGRDGVRHMDKGRS